MIQSPPKSVSRDVLTDRVYEVIKEQIIEQVLKPSQRLELREIAENLEVSSTPVREALVRLTYDKLVLYENHRGFTVAPLLDPGRLAELFDVCAWLQSKAVKLGASTVTGMDLQALEQATAGMEASYRGQGYEAFRAFRKHDREFHDRIMLISRNSFLVELWNSLNPHAHSVRLIYLAFSNGEIVNIYNAMDHRPIVDALRSRDPLSASNAVKQHVQFAKQLWLSLAERMRSLRVNREEKGGRQNAIAQG